MLDRPAASVSYNYSGRVILVTGGCSGIGLATCEAFVRSQAAHVICADVDVQAGSQLPHTIEFMHCDTSIDSDCRDLIDRVIDDCGQIDVLVNNAAIQPPDSYRPLHELSLDVQNRMVAINLMGYANMARHALRHMVQRRSGVIVNVASGQGHRTARGVGAYGPIKAATIMQARQWGVEYARHGIRAVSVSPGAINTPLVQTSLRQQGGEAALANRHPLGRIGQPDEIANAILWLSSDHAAFITATDLEVDGGLGAFAAFAEPYPMRDS